MIAESNFSRLFGRSPFRALQEHSNTVQACVHVLPGLFATLAEGESVATSKLIDEVFKLESDADHIKNDLRTHLPRSLFLPVDRRDLLEILDLQDSIADTAQEIAGLFQEREMELPAALAAPLQDLLARSVDACDQSNRIISELDELIATGFRGRESDTVATMVDELNRIESDTDKKGMSAARALFSLESKLAPVCVIMWHDVIKMIGGVADYSEKVGNRVRLLIAR